MNPVLWLDDVGRPGWIALMIVSFVLFPPAGLVVLGYLIGSGRLMGCWTDNRGERWQRRMARMQQRMQERAARWCGPGNFAGNFTRGPWANSAWTQRGGSGNRAFDEYRDETLRRLEEEERQFKEFLDRLRQAKDKAEFDQFMAEMRSHRPEGPMPQPEG
jgi:Protein of unknown function (DUF2852)